MDLAETSLVLGVDIIEEETSERTRTYNIDFENGRIYGFCDGLEACKQAMTKILLTERFKNLIYSDEYGSEVLDAFMAGGFSDEFLETEIPALVTEALMEDVRVLNVDNFKLNLKGDEVDIECDVTTIYGNIRVKAVM
jgi:hypothetical protein